MTAATMQQAVEKLRYSSAYAAGDRLTFKLPLEPGKLELPGQSDPVSYLDLVQQAFQFTLPSGARVAVVGAGYGGLASALLLRGVRHVVVIEPRFRFHAGLDAVCPLLTEIHTPQGIEVAEGTETVTAFKTWPTMAHVDKLGQFDLVISPEGFDECPDPVELLCAMIAMTKPGGLCALEVTIGETVQIPTGPVNAWRPTQAAFAELVKLSGLGERVRQTAGRGTNRILYGVASGEMVKPQIASRTYSEPMPLPGVEPNLGLFSQSSKWPKPAPVAPVAPAVVEAPKSEPEKEELLWDREAVETTPEPVAADPDPDYEAVAAAASAEFDLRPAESKAAAEAVSTTAEAPEAPSDLSEEETIVLVDDEDEKVDPEPEGKGKSRKRKRSG